MVMKGMQKVPFYEASKEQFYNKLAMEQEK